MENYLNLGGQNLNWYNLHLMLNISYAMQLVLVYLHPFRCNSVLKCAPHILKFKVADFGVNEKSVCDFLLLINSNLNPISHRF